MTINKSQGQTFDKVGIYLCTVATIHHAYEITLLKQQCEFYILLQYIFHTKSCHTSKKWWYKIFSYGKHTFFG